MDSHLESASDNEAPQSLLTALRVHLLAQHPELDVPLVSTNQVRVIPGTNPPAALPAAK